MTPKRLVRGVLKRMPIGKNFVRAYDIMEGLRDCPGAHDLGSYQSPIPKLSEIRADRDRIFALPEEIPGIPLNAEAQRALGAELAPFVAECPFPATLTPPWRYYGENDFFTWGDSLVLHALIRHFRPARILEVGSGFSSAVILDTVEHYLGDATRCTFVEPFPDRLRSLLRPEDERRCTVIVDRVQSLGLDSFRELSAGDILLIDSSHVSKVGSDVNWLFFEVLPQLAPGVLVHVHDVFYPFEYPEDLFPSGYALNEAYMLRAFLIFNDRFRIIFWNDYLKKCDGDWLARTLPGCLKRWSSSIWLRSTEAPR
jgi:Methyltransferase domain